MVNSQILIFDSIKRNHQIAIDWFVIILVFVLSNCHVYNSIRLYLAHFPRDCEPTVMWMASMHACMWREYVESNVIQCWHTLSLKKPVS